MALQRIIGLTHDCCGSCGERGWARYVEGNEERNVERWVRTSECNSTRGVTSRLERATQDDICTYDDDQDRHISRRFQ
jgi:hypothetical protein